MKNRIKSILLALMTVFAMTACAPQDNDDHSLGAKPEESKLAFAATPTAAKPNVVELRNESSITGVVTWDFGNGMASKGESVKAEYPFAGEYTVAMTMYNQGGSTTITKVITIAQDDMSLLDTPMYNALTGGAANLAGKTWVFDEYHAGHFGVGPVKNDDGSDNKAPTWWSCPAEGKKGSSLYTQEFTFVQVGVKLAWKNNGYVYSNEAGKNALGGDFVKDPGGAGDFDVKYTLKEGYTFSLNEAENTITLNGGSFFGHYTGSSVYYILKLTENELYLKNVSAVEPGNAWWYRLIPKEKNVKPEVPLKAVALKEDFEKEKSTIVFEKEDMGTLFSQYYQNPLPLPVNPSAHVCLYQKTDAFYSNIFYAVNDYKFDLKELNKVRLKVYIPSGNDYTTVVEKAGDWIEVDKLQSQVSIKLQNSELGGSSYTTQHEIKQVNLVKDKWLDLTFDFSVVKERTDFDRIVIQFGAEGHKAPGIFYFDDFSFDK